MYIVTIASCDAGVVSVGEQWATENWERAVEIAKEAVSQSSGEDNTDVFDDGYEWSSEDGDFIVYIGCASSDE